MFGLRPLPRLRLPLLLELLRDPIEANASQSLGNLRRCADQRQQSPFCKHARLPSGTWLQARLVRRSSLDSTQKLEPKNLSQNGY
jgi:hypothetical protein